MFVKQKFAKESGLKKTDERVVTERAAQEATQSFRRSYTHKELKAFMVGDDWWEKVQKVCHLMARARRSPWRCQVHMLSGSIVCHATLSRLTPAVCARARRSRYML